MKVHSQSGLLSTALCCLDRETTPEYQLQVVATDGGGLKGTIEFVLMQNLYVDFIQFYY